jgi:hypothetical protein
MRTFFHLALAGFSALVLAIPAPAQTTVRGRLLDAASGAAIMEGTVVVAASRGRWQATTLTDSAGNFEFDSVAAGPYRLRASRIGYREAAGDLALAADSTVSVELRMSAQSVVLQPVTVVARSQRRGMSAEMRGFYDRMQTGSGRFVTRDEIQARRAGRVTDVLLGVPNLNASSGRMGTSGHPMSRGSASAHCQIMYFIDGVRMVHPMPNAPRVRPPEFVVDDYVSPSEVQGIEVYRGEADTPSQFVTPLVRCGTIVIWTRRGGRNMGD